MGNDAASYYTQGQALYGQSVTLANGGGLGAMMGAASGLVALLPASQVSSLVETITTIATDAAAGMAMGSVIPGFGTAVGAAAGAIIGVVNAMVASFSANDGPIGDFRYEADQYIFPATLNAALNSFTPGQQNNPVRPKIVAYMYPADGNWSLEFDFGVTWVSPFPEVGSAQNLANPQAPTSSDDTRSKARALVMQYMATNIVTTLDTLTNPNLSSGDIARLKTQIAQIQVDYDTAFGSNQTQQAAAMALLESWIGPRSSFSTTDPTSQFGQMYACDASGDILPQSTATVDKAWGIALANMLDWTYYPLPVYESIYNPKQPAPCPPGNETNLFFAVNLLACGLGEIAISPVASDWTALHYMMAMGYSYMQGAQKDALKYPGVYVMHPNIARILGIIATKMQVGKGGPSATTAAASAASAPLSTGGKVAVAGGIAATAAVAGVAYTAYSNGTTFLGAARAIGNTLKRIF